MAEENLSKEERELLNRMRANWKLVGMEEEKFWKEIYIRYTFDEKVGFWAGLINQQMRWQVESGLDEYAIFTKSWYDEIKLKEPDFDLIIDKAFEGFLNWEWSKDEYLKRISSDPTK